MKNQLQDDAGWNEDGKERERESWSSESGGDKMGMEAEGDDADGPGSQSAARASTDKSQVMAESAAVPEESTGPVGPMGKADWTR